MKAKSFDEINDIINKIKKNIKEIYYSDHNNDLFYDEIFIKHINDLNEQLEEVKYKIKKWNG